MKKKIGFKSVQCSYSGKIRFEIKAIDTICDRYDAFAVNIKKIKYDN